jgi:3-phosphoshikimate 1-carboxyvinyltransferase
VGYAAATMPLPPVLEIVPLERPVRAEITVPGSKSITNRALVLAALGTGTTTLRGALWSDDTQVMAEALGRLGFEVTVAPDPDEPSNRTISVAGRGGLIPRAGTPEAPLELAVGNAGTAARFLAALVCLGSGSYRLSGVARMHERPQAPLFTALGALGYRIEASPGGKLPAIIHGAGPRPGRVQVGAAESSQFASALLLGAGAGGWQVEIAGGGAFAGIGPGRGDRDDLPYVEMTRALIRAFPAGGGSFVVEPDASSGSYLWAAGWLLDRPGPTAGSRVAVREWPRSGWQIDAAFPGLLPLPPSLSRERDLGDAIMTAVVLAALGDRATSFTDLGRLRMQECERVVALRTELGSCGIDVKESGDTLIVEPGTPHGAEIRTYGDHRIAMCFATLGLVVPGLRIVDPACVNKTFPSFFAKLGAPPPAGLGARILDATTRAPLPPAALHA